MSIFATPSKPDGMSVKYKFIINLWNLWFQPEQTNFQPQSLCIWWKKKSEPPHLGINRSSTLDCDLQVRPFHQLNQNTRGRNRDFFPETLKIACKFKVLQFRIERNQKRLDCLNFLSSQPKLPTEIVRFEPKRHDPKLHGAISTSDRYKSNSNGQVTIQVNQRFITKSNLSEFPSINAPWRTMLLCSALNLFTFYGSQMKWRTNWNACRIDIRPVFDEDSHKFFMTYKKEKFDQNFWNKRHISSISLFRTLSYGWMERCVIVFVFNIRERWILPKKWSDFLMIFWIPTSKGEKLNFNIHIYRTLEDKITNPKL